jgi:hypothetical protein
MSFCVWDGVKQLLPRQGLEFLCVLLCDVFVGGGGWMRVEAVSECAEEHGDEEAPAQAVAARKESAHRCG